MQRRGGRRDQRGKEKPKTDTSSSASGNASAAEAEAVSNRIGGLSISEDSGQARVSVQGGENAIWKPKSYGTVSGSTAVEVGKASTDQISSVSLSKLFRGDLLENFTVDNSTYAHAQVRATFYPKFENEKSDQEVWFDSQSVLASCLSNDFFMNLIAKYAQRLLDNESIYSECGFQIIALPFIF